MRIPSNRVRAAATFFINELSEFYSRRECEAIMRIAFEDLLGIPPTAFHSRAEERLTESELLKIIYLLKDLKKGIPVQYSIGFTWFCGLKIRTDKRALIPRPETEELVMMIRKDLENHPPHSVLDIGTGTGCIALALKSYFPHADVTAVDISEDALNLASENAGITGLDVHLVKASITDAEALPRAKFDLIVSNPPYITPDEASGMQALVLNNEPPQALFTPDNDPLFYYRHISQYAEQFLSEEGRLYFEVHENYAKETAEVVKQKFKNVNLVQDIHHKNRMVCATKY